MTAEVVDLFAGPGGWSEACKALGLDELGIESDPAACQTRLAADHRTIRADVTAFDPAAFAGARGLIASPPCQAFSNAGKGAGRDLIPDLADAIRRRDWHSRPDPDPRVWLVLEVGRWADTLRPEWVTLEQVPAVLPLWEAYARWLDQLGYTGRRLHHRTLVRTTLTRRRRRYAYTRKYAYIPRLDHPPGPQVAHPPPRRLRTRRRLVMVRSR